MELDPKQKKKLEKLAKVVKGGNIAIFEQLVELDEKVDEVKQLVPDLHRVLQEVKGDKGDPGDPADPVDEESIVQEVLRRIPTPENGKDADEEAIVRRVVSQIKIPIDGKDAVVDYDKIVAEVISLIPIPEDGKDGSPDTAEDIRNKLELLTDEDRLDVSAIRGLDKREDGILNRALGILDKRTQYLLNKTTSAVAQLFTSLTDVPHSYTGQGGKAVRVNAGETGLEFFSAAGSGTVTSVGSADSSVTVTNPTTTPDLAVASSPKLTTARNIDGQSFDGTANITVIAPGTHAATSKATPVDADELPLVDSAASNVLKKLTWANVKATLKTYFDGIYQAAGSYITASSTDILANKDLTSGTNTFPTFNQNTTGSAAKWTTARNLAGNSVDGSANVAFANKFVVQGTTDAGLSAAQFLGALGTGIVKNTTTTGVLSIATGADLPAMTATVGGAVPTPPNNTTTFLRGDGTFATPSGGGTVTNTGGSLTANAVVLGAGTNDTKVVAGVTTDGTSQLNLGVNTTTLGKVKMFGSTSGDATIQPNVVAGTATVLTLPATTDTLVGKATTDTLTNKTYDTAGTGNSFSINGLAATANTGTGAVVRATSPALVTPALGTPASGTLTNTTGFPTANLAGAGSGVLTFLATPSSANLASAITDETGSGALVFGTTPTIATPVINGLPTGTGVASAATVSTLAARDANGNLTAVDFIEGFTTTATAAGTTTLTVTSTYTQVFTGSSTQTVKLPTTSVAQGQQYLIINQSTGAVTVQSSGANAITILAANTSAIFTAVIATPTTAANWNAQYQGVNAASGKVGTINNTLTFAGTDATTMTFPTTSATIARTDAVNAFAGAGTTFTDTAASLTLGAQGTGSTTTPTTLDMGGSFADTIVSSKAKWKLYNDGTTINTYGIGITSGQFNFFKLTGGGYYWYFSDVEKAHLDSSGNYVITGGFTAAAASSIGTSNAFTTGTIELGAASDTTLSRSSAGVLAVEGVVIPSISSTNTFTNKRITKRVSALSAGSATPAINTDNFDVVHITAQSAAITSFTTNLTGTPADGDTLRISITDNGTARAITWGTSFEASTVALPTTTVISTRLDVGFFWNSDTSKWRCVAVA